MFLKNKIKLFFKKTNHYNSIRKLYLSIFRKGYFYHFIQKYFVSLKIRRFLANIERKIFNIIIKDKNFFSQNYNSDNRFSELLHAQGVTDSFKPESVIKYKEEIIQYFKKQKIFNDKDVSKTLIHNTLGLRHEYPEPAQAGLNF